MAFACVALTLLIGVVLTQNVSSAKIPLRPVYEKTGENIDSYGNPLAANSPAMMQQRARVHAHNQQRRFNSEKDRMQRAQRQRFMNHGGETMDSYVQAYKDQQEAFHKEIEKKQAKDVKEVVPQHHRGKNNKNTVGVHVDSKVLSSDSINDQKTAATTLNDFSNAQWWKNTNIRNKRVNTASPAPPAIQRSDRKRNERAHIPISTPFVLSSNAFIPMQGVAHSDYAQLFAQSHGRHHVDPNTVVIPHFAPSQHVNTDDVSTLTSSALSNAQLQNQFSQLRGYKTVEDIQSLNALLGKGPDDQLRGLNQLLHGNPNHKLTSEDLRNSRINIKASSLDVPREKYDHGSTYAASSYQPQFTYSFEEEDQPQQKDHTPITENVQDIADPRKPIHIGSVSQFYPTEPTPSHASSTSFYKVEVSNNVVAEPPKAEEKYHHELGSSSYTTGHDNVSIEVVNKTGPRTVTPLRFGDRLVVIKKRKGFIDVDVGQRRANRTKRQINPSVYNQHKKSRIATSIRLKRFEASDMFSSRASLDKKVTASDRIDAPKSELFLDTDIFVTGKDFETPNNISDNNLNANNSTDNEFYYYDDDSVNNNTNFNFDDFSTDDELENNKNLTYNDIFNVSTTNNSENPHYESLIRYKTMKKPALYRIFNGVKTRVSKPNPHRFRSFLIKKPSRDYNYRNYRPSDQDFLYYNMKNHRKLRLYNQNNGGVAYSDPEEYDGSSEYEDNYDEEYNYDGDNIEPSTIHYNKASNPYEANDNDILYHQYASNFNQQDDYITYENPYYNDKFNRYKQQQRIPQAYHTRDPIPKFYRYASGYNENDDYINDDTYNDYASNVKGYRINPQRYSNLYTNDYEGDDFSEDSDFYTDYFNKHRNYPQTQSHDANYNRYVDDNDDYDDPYENSYNYYFNKQNVNSNRFGSVKPKNKPLPSNYYVENYNQYVSHDSNGQKQNVGWHSGYKQMRKSPQSVFNIFRGKKPHQLRQEHCPDCRGDSIHIDSLNVFHGKQHHVGHHHPKRPQKHNLKRPIRWHKPRVVHKRNNRNRSKEQLLRVHKNINKINQLHPFK